MQVQTGKKRKERPITSYFAPHTNAVVQPVETIRESINNALRERKSADNPGGKAEVPPVVRNNIRLHARGSRDRYGPMDTESPSMMRYDDTATTLSDENLSIGLRVKTEIKMPLKTKHGEEKPKRSTDLDDRSVSSSMHNNILSQLLKRSVLGSRVKVQAPSKITWKEPAWLTLGPVPSGQPAYGVNCLAWDSLGVLLACACTDGVVRIFDWDVVLAADIKGRNMWARNKSGSALIEPVIEFPLRGRHVAFLKWNPFQPDEIAVGLRSSDGVNLYDLPEVAAWQQCRGGFPPCRRLECRASIQHDSRFLFVDGEHALLASGQDLYCWRTVSRAVKWKFQWRRMTCMEIATPSVVIVGSSDGHLSLIDWKQTQRTSFSLKPSPTVVCQWLSWKGLECPPPSEMGIRRLSIHAAANEGQSQELRSQVTWVTNCGWVLSSCISPRRSPKKADIHHMTKPVRFVSAKGMDVDSPREAWSLPIGPVQADVTGPAIVFEKVPAVTHILPHHDNRVLDSKPRQVRSNTKPSLLWFSVDNAKVSPIGLSKRKGEPCSIAIHPGEQWIVIGTESNGVYALNARGMAP